MTAIVAEADITLLQRDVSTDYTDTDTEALNLASIWLAPCQARALVIGECDKRPRCKSVIMYIYIYIKIIYLFIYLFIYSFIY